MRRRSASQAPEHWSKDFVEHLRSVHFTLVTVSVGLIGILSYKSYDAKKAATEMNQLVELTSKPLLVAPKLKATKADNHEIPYSSKFEAKAKGVTYQFSIDEPNLYQCGKPDTRYYLKPLRVINSPLSARTIASTQKIVDPWSDSPLFSIEAINRAGTVKDGDGHTEALVIMQPISAFDSDHGGNLRLAVDCANGVVKGLMDGISDFGDDRPPTFQFSVILSLQEQHLDEAFRWVQFESFRKYYSDLLEAARGRENLDFSILAPQIYAEAEKGDEPFEAFGLKIPENRIAGWGIVVLISIQLYFVMYLRRLSNKLKPEDPGWDVPWMAMDESKLARGMLFVSIVLLPMSAAFAVAARADRLGNSIGEQIEGVTALCGLLLSWVLGLLSWAYRPKLRGPTAPSQLFE